MILLVEEESSIKWLWNGPENAGSDKNAHSTFLSLEVVRCVNLTTGIRHASGERGSRRSLDA